MPTIKFSDALVARLQPHAIPLVDTFETLIDRLVDHWESTKSDQPKVFKPGEPLRKLNHNTMEFSSANPPGLAFTSCTQIVIEDRQLAKSDTNWNNMMIEVIRLVHTKGKDADTIHAMLTVNAVVGSKQDNGYKYLKDVGLSVQGQDSNAAFRQAYQLAVFNGIKGNVFFQWQNNGKAIYPNQHGYMEF